MIPILTLNKENQESIFQRTFQKANVEDIVADILANVRQRGDEALLEYTAKFDRAQLQSLLVSDEEIEEAFAKADPSFVAVLQESARNIEAFHRNQLRSSFVMTAADGVVMGQKILPIEKVGLYIPGGTAAYPSSVLMNCIPAKIAGCSKIVMVSPPTAGGSIAPAILVAAKVAGVDQIFKVGGAQAVAALAYGTQSIPKVDKIVGPGNAFVAEAKKQVFGQVAIDIIAGPSEILVVADGSCDARYVAADLLSQAEHDKLASAVLVTDSPALAEAVQAELSRQLPLLAREEIARCSLENNGKIILTESIAQAIEVSNALAPEHLEICVDNPFDYLDSVKNAGSVFLGKNCPEALGDYFAGTNHTLPTSGTARFSSPLSVDDFIKKTQYTYYTSAALRKAADKVALFARQEGLTAHAVSAEIRMGDEAK